MVEAAVVGSVVVGAAVVEDAVGAGAVALAGLPWWDPLFWARLLLELPFAVVVVGASVVLFLT